MRRTLLDLTQSILSSLNSDEVNSIGDTTEATQVANIIRDTYYNIMGRAELPEHEKLFSLTPSGDVTKPVLMYRPEEGVVKINWIKYFDSNINDGSSFTDQFGAFSHNLNVDLQPIGWSTTSSSTVTINTGPVTFVIPAGISTIAVNQTVMASSGVNSMSGTVTSYSGQQLVLQITAFSGTGTFSSWIIKQTNPQLAPPGYQDVIVLPFTQFLNMVNSFNPTDSNVQSFTFVDFLNQSEAKDQFTINYKTDKTPQYCTCIQNYYFIFDSYDSTQDSTLQSIKTQVSGFITPTFTMQDTFYPDLDDWAFPLLLNEALAKATFELKGTLNPHAEREIDRQWSALQKTKAIVNKPSFFDQLPDFGRNLGGRGYGRNNGNVRGGYGRGGW